ncbi:MAG: hypothetical protein ACHRXM_39410 [Isosphaerales bacterium]
MSEHQQSEDDLRISMKNLPSHDLLVWLEDMQSRVHRLRDPENPLEPELKFQELGNMFECFLFLSKRLLELAGIANQARGSMVKPSMEENEKRGPES